MNLYGKSDNGHVRNSILLALIIVWGFSLLFASYGQRGQNSTKDKTRIQLNKYYNYVHFQPEWDSYPRNILFDVTTQWIRDEYDLSKSGHEKLQQGGAQQRVNQLQYLEGKGYLEVKYDYIDCSYQWIHYARYGTDMVVSQLDYMSGKQTEPNNFTSFSKVSGPDRGDSLELNINGGYSQFIPICTSKDEASFDYGVRVDDKDMYFDVYFVPSVQERHNFHYNSTAFTHYKDEECFGKNYQSYSGTCSVDKDGGLLIVVPDELKRSLTRVTVKLKENLTNENLAR